MKERPILFNSEMVRAILGGRKTQTRRPVIPQPEVSRATHIDGDTLDEFLWREDLPDIIGPEDMVPYSPFGVVGDHLWVREAFYVQPDLVQLSEPQPIHYRADVSCCGQVEDYVCKPSIHMPRWASRIILEVTGVRVEQVQDMTFGDRMAEGIDAPGIVYRPGWPPPPPFSSVWDPIYAKRGLGWEVNPWVWVCEFKVLTVDG